MYFIAEIDDTDDDSVSGLFVITILLSYTALSALAFTFWESWTFLNSLYFCLITMFTIGFGDLVSVDVLPVALSTVSNFIIGANAFSTRTSSLSDILHCFHLYRYVRLN
jgi:hypothetical protein